MRNIRCICNQYCAACHDEIDYVPPVYFCHSHTHAIIPFHVIPIVRANYKKKFHRLRPLYFWILPFEIFFFFPPVGDLGWGTYLSVRSFFSSHVYAIFFLSLLTRFVLTITITVSYQSLFFFKQKKTKSKIHDFKFYTLLR